MSVPIFPACRRVGIGLMLAFCLALRAEAASSPEWVGTWATAPQPELATKEPLPFAGSTLRQMVHVSLGGEHLRLRLSNLFGAEPLVLRGVHLAIAAPEGAIQPDTDHAVRFAGETTVTIPAGASVVSDPLEFALRSQDDLAVSIHFQAVPATLTAHPGSRTTSYLVPGDALTAAALPGATKVVHWYFIAALDVVAESSAGATVVVLGDSIADGRGSTTDHNDRWPDALARRLQADASAKNIGVLNSGIGGNRLLRDGIGPSALTRFDRDVLAQTAAAWVIVHIGINDIGTRINARKRGETFASAAEIIAGYEQLIARSHAQGLQIYGATITPYAGADFYWTEDGESDRQTVNAWIRARGHFDAVVDFDAAVEDPQHPAHLAPAFDSGDHLHLSPAGYVAMARAVNLELLQKRTESKPAERR